MFDETQRFSGKTFYMVYEADTVEEAKIAKEIVKDMKYLFRTTSAVDRDYDGEFRTYKLWAHDPNHPTGLPVKCEML